MCVCVCGGGGEGRGGGGGVDLFLFLKEDVGFKQTGLHSGFRCSARRVCVFVT